MVLCFLALPIFAILGIFSIKYRKLTLDALECLFKTATLRKCESGLDDKIKSDLTGKVLKLSPKTAKFFYKHYKIISWIILIIFIWSLYGTSVGMYNYYKHGNCNGENSDEFCIFDPLEGISTTKTGEPCECLEETGEDCNCEPGEDCGCATKTGEPCETKPS